MTESGRIFKAKFEDYCNSFSDLSEEQHKNFIIKKEHSVRVADLIFDLATKLELSVNDCLMAYYIGLFHDIGRFNQLVEYNTFNDSKSIDHAEYSVKVLKAGDFFYGFSEDQKKTILLAIQNHNKRELPKGLSKEQSLFSKLIRDADKLDILKVLSDYYTNPKATPNHTLTWEMPKGKTVSAEVTKEILSGKLVSKGKITNELEIKVMQLSWVYDINFKPSFGKIMSDRYLEKIYTSMPKNDSVIEIYRKVKVYSENKLISQINQN